MRWRHIILRGLGVACCLGFVQGCAHWKPNPPLTAVSRDRGYYFHNQQRPHNSPEIVFVLAFSGGGTRAAALSYGVLEELRNTALVSEGESRRLLDEVDGISAVSGGSVTAAAYGTLGQKMFSVLDRQFLKHNVQRDLAWRVLNPVNWPALWSPTYSRSDLAQEYFDKLLFHGKTFADIAAEPVPYIVINATDISTGARFGFTQYQFDLLCSDIGPVPVARAVAASSAVPGVLSPITLQNYAGRCGYTPATWITRSYSMDDGRIRLPAYEYNSYLDSATRPYIHLVDGGVSDNLGLRSILDALLVLEADPAAAQLEVKEVRKVVVISVNAYSDPKRSWDQNPSPPSSILVAAAAAGRTLDRYSVETLQLVREEVDRWKQRQGGGGETKVYSIFINFNDFKEDQTRNFFMSLPTSFFLPGTSVDRLVAAGHELLRQNANYRALLRDLGATLPDYEPPAAHAPRKATH